MKQTRILAATLALAFAFSAAATHAASIREAGRAVAERHGDAVIRVNVITSMKMAFGGQQGNESDVESEINGTLIGPDGLTLVPLSEIDPSSMLRRRFGNRMDEQFQIDTRVKDLRLIMPDGAEIPATVVLRDSDLDVALLRPKEKTDRTFPALDLTQSAAVPDLLDEVMVLVRFGRIANRSIGVMTGEVQGHIRRPRLFHVPSSELATGGMGAPIFDAEQRLVGFVLMRMIQMSDSGSLFGGDDGSSLVVILPAEDVAEIAAQAPQEGEPMDEEPAADEQTEQPQEETPEQN